ncbi:MAG: PP2C family protein-serine/threonine phosphatase [Nocardioidaceae bacterium]
MAGRIERGLPARASALSRVRRRTVRFVREGRADETTWLLGLIVITFGCVLGSATESNWFPLSTFAIPLLAGTLVLERARFAILVGVVFVALAATVGVLGWTTIRGSFLVVMALAAAILLYASARSRLGGGGTLGESMLIDLRDRLRTQSELPALPPQWTAEALMRSAGGAQFAGDFIVAAKTQGNTTLEVAVVDVSGKGVAAGARALQLSGAFGGLLGSLTPEEFLPAANGYLLRQDWVEGFATAAHLALHLESGRFELRTAGHPPGLQWRAGSGRWQVHESSGAALGLIEDTSFVSVTGQLGHGDVLLLYTDGLVETPDRDFTLGIDKLLGEAERLLRGGWHEGAQRLLDRVDVSSDDRAILFLHRR